MKIAIYGGMFSPPHIGHMYIAQQIAESGLWDKVCVMPNCSGLSSMKTNFISAKTRLDLCRLAFEPFALSGVEVSDYSINYQLDYTYQVVERLTKDFPEDDFTFFIGDDWDITSFKEYPRIESVVNKGLVRFIKIKKLPIECNKPFLMDNIFRPNIFFNISSTVIRKRVSEGKVITGLVHYEVERYIWENKVYKKDTP